MYIPNLSELQKGFTYFTPCSYQTWATWWQQWLEKVNKTYSTTSDSISYWNVERCTSRPARKEGKHNSLVSLVSSHIAISKHTRHSQSQTTLSTAVKEKKRKPQWKYLSNKSSYKIWAFSATWLTTHHTVNHVLNTSIERKPLPHMEEKVMRLMVCDLAVFQIVLHDLWIYFYLKYFSAFLGFIWGESMDIGRKHEERKRCMKCNKRLGPRNELGHCGCMVW